MKRAFHWALGEISSADRDWILAKADAHGFEMEEASILIDNAFDLSNARAGEEKIREIALGEIRKVLGGYGYVLEKERHSA